MTSPHEDRWKLAMQCVGDGVWDWDCLANTISSSPEWPGMLGYEPAEFEESYEEWIHRVHPDDIDLCLKSWREHINRKAPIYEAVYRIRTKSNEYKWILDRGKIIEWQADGRPRRVVGTHTDIDRSKRTEFELEAQKRILLSFVEHAPVPVAMFDLNLCYLACSSQWARQYETESHALLGRHHYDVDPTIPEHWRAVHMRCLNGAEESREEERYLALDGSERWIRWECRPWRLGNDEIGGIVLFAEDVTRRRQIANELGEQKKLLAAIIDSSTAGIWDWKIASDDLIVSAKLKEICGYDPDDLPDGPGLWQILTLPDDEEKRRKALELHISSRGEHPFSEILRYSHRNGGQVVVICTGTVVKWTNEGHPERMVGCHIDITDQFHIREELARTRNFLEQTNRAAKAGGWEIDLVTRQIFWSDITRELHEVGEEYQTSLDGNINFYKEGWSRDRIRTVVTRAIEEGRSFDEELELITGKGNTRWVRALGHAEFRNGRCVRLYGAFLDIHESKLIRESLKTQEQRFRGFYELSPVGIAMSDFETGAILDFNESMRQSTGYPVSEMASLRYEAMISPEGQDDWIKALKTLDTTGRFGPLEIDFMRKDGSRFPGKINGFLLKPEGGKPVVWSIVEDITERRAAELNLRAAIKVAEAANAAKSSFLAMMSHEIRTPLNGIIGSSDILVGTTLTQDQRDLITIIQKSGESLLKIINDILDYSKVEAGRLEIETISFSMKNLVEEVMGLLKPVAEMKHLTLRGSVDNDFPQTILGDPTRIKQVLINLVGNAIKFTHAGSVTVHAVCVRSDWMRVEVADTGIGIDAERVESLYEAFTQGDSSTTRKFGGTGLGLTISKKLIELMQGILGVRSGTGSGSTFWFEIPLLVPKEATDSRYAPLQVVPADFNKQIRVLIAEDNPINQTLVVRLLRSLGLSEIRVANHGAEAVEIFKAEQFDLVLMDSQMPEMDGYEATRLIRTYHDGSRPLRVIGLSALAMSGDRKNALDAGMDDYLTKPVRRDVLAQSLEYWFPAATE